MKFEETFDFDFGRDTIQRMFCDEDYYLDKYEKLGGRKPEVVGTERTESGFSITVRHALEASKLSFPDVIKKRIGDRIMLRQTDRWDRRAATGHIEITIEKAPVTVDIDMRLHGRDAAGSRLTLGFDIAAQIPLLGSRIEKAIAGPITQRMHKDLALSNKLAADYAE